MCRPLFNFAAYLGEWNAYLVEGPAHGGIIGRANCSSLFPTDFASIQQSCRICRLG